MSTRRPSGGSPLTPSRLTLARKRRGLTLVQLATAVGVSVRSLSTYENGRQDPTEDTQHRLAEALDVPVGFLRAGDVDEIPPAAISFRAPSKLTAGQRDTARSAGRIALLLAEWIEQRFELPGPDVPSLPNLDPETAAEVVRARWGLGNGALGNLVRLLEAHGVRVYSLTAECAAVDAFSFVWHQTPYVLLNTGKSGERGRFDAAHELGHLVLHSEHRLPQGPDAEQEANRFAAALLMPRAAVLGHGLANATIDRILSAKQTWRVAAMALTHRLHELGLLSDWSYRTACVDLSRRGYRTGEPGGIARETSPLLASVFQTLRAEGIGPADIASDLHLTVPEVNRHVFGLVPVAVNGGAARTPPKRPKLTLLTN
ncbi:ImmA/IrrE family metallo-endopeptidase [Rugosimonospora acidiphila]|uniref:ImmA/IrrE family metallo-endopeptidase n=1 Tax=Rugosimonospora acidiphila TaxID=556531 RepID=A0ABP9SA22_9ACTN